MKKLKKLFALILVVAVLLATVGCVNKSNTESARDRAKQTDGDTDKSDNSDDSTNNDTISKEENGGNESGSSTNGDTISKEENSGNDSNTSVNNDNSSSKDNNTDERLLKALESKHTLRFNDNGQFKVLVLSDLHLKPGGIPETMKSSIKTLIDRESPDLVLLNGDNVDSSSIKSDADMRLVLSEAVEYIESKQIPWMHVFGNHDSEYGYTREQQQAVYQTFNYCISKKGDADLKGVSNYVVPIYGSEDDTVKFAVWGLDSGDYLSNDDKASLFPTESAFGGCSGAVYDYIHGDQIEWYVEISKRLEKQNGGQVVPGLMSFHIPLQETYTAWLNRSGLDWTGEKREEVCASAHNSGLFNAMLSRGDIKAVINGHDHKNDFMVEYGGIKLCYASTVSVNTYHDSDMHGGRVFVINEKDTSNVETYMSYVNQKVDPANAKPRASGYTYDFEGSAPQFTLSSWPNDISTDAYVNEISAQIFSGAGRNGSKALGVTRLQYHEGHRGKNIEVKWNDYTYGKLGDNRYLMVWIDLDKNSIDFRKACFGLLTDYKNSYPYATDNHDEPSPFYYKADGSDTWVTLSTGTDGCIGESDSCSVSGYKGWLALPIEYMLQSGTDKQLNEDSVITGFYFYLSLATQDMTGKYVYIDDIMLVEDYTQY